MKGWIIFLSVFALYFVSIFGGFVQDDVKVIAGDPEIGTVKSLVQVWTRPYYYQENEKSIYRPVTSFSFYANALVTGKNAWGFRLGNVLLYAWVCWLVYIVMKKFGKACIAISRNTETRNDDIMKDWMPDQVRHDKIMNEIRNEGWRKDLAFWGAMVFLVLPIHTEVVNNIVGRAEILSLGFLLLAMLENFKNRWDLSAVFLLLAMLSKETAVVGVPILIYLIGIRGIDLGISGWIPDQGLPGDSTTRNHKKWNGDIKSEKIAAVVLVMMALVGFVMMRLLVLGSGGVETRATKVENPLKFVGAEKRMMNGIALIPFGVGKVIFPLNLSYDYSYNQIKLVDKWTDWRVVMGILMVVFSGIYLYRFRVTCSQVLKLTSSCRRELGMTKTTNTNLQGDSLKVLSVVGMMLLWGPILITGNILFPIGTIFGERLWFLPSLGAVFLFVFSLQPRSLLDTDNSSVPATDGYLGTRLKFSSAKKLSNFGLGKVVQRKSSRRLLEGIEGIEGNDKFKVLKITSGFRIKFGMMLLFAVLMIYVGRTFVRNLDWLSQERLFLHDGGVATESVMAQSNKAAIYLMKNDLENAKKYMEKANEIFPKYPELLNNWGLYYSWTRKKEEAKKKFEECLVQRPGYELCISNFKVIKGGL